MRLIVCSVYDKAVQAFMQPFFVRSKGEAVRSFTDACANREQNFNKFASDYSLYEMGEFDDQSGIFVSKEPVRIISALEVLPDDPVIDLPDLRSNGAGKQRVPM